MINLIVDSSVFVAVLRKDEDKHKKLEVNKYIT